MSLNSCAWGGDDQGCTLEGDPGSGLKGVPLRVSRGWWLNDVSLRVPVGMGSDCAQ